MTETKVHLVVKNVPINKLQKILDLIHKELEK